MEEGPSRVYWRGLGARNTGATGEAKLCGLMDAIQGWGELAQRKDVPASRPSTAHCALGHILVPLWTLYGLDTHFPESFQL